MVVRPEFSHVLGLAGVKEAHGIDDAHSLRVELLEVDAALDDQVHSFLYQQVFRVVLKIAAQGDGSHHDVCVVQLAGRHETVVLAHGAEVSILAVAVAVKQRLHILAGDGALNILELHQDGQAADLALADAAAFHQSFLRA